MKCKKLGIALGVLLCAIAGAGGIWASAAAETSVTNRLSTSVVKREKKRCPLQKKTEISR